MRRGTEFDGVKATEAHFHRVGQLLASRHDAETRMLTMKHKVLDLEQELKKLKQRLAEQKPGVPFGNLG